MAEINTTAGANRRRGVVRSKKLSTRVDLTPMVDLGFLLITFFVFTTTISQPATMSLYLPADSDTHETPVPQSTALTIIPISNDKVFYYHGQLQNLESNGLFGVTDFSITDGIGEIIRQKQKTIEATTKFKRDAMMVVIRPSDDCRYQNVIDALDEMTINLVKRYALVDLTEAEKKFMQQHGIK
jgi:biopolymer transport protein ExbD